MFKKKKIRIVTLTLAAVISLPTYLAAGEMENLLQNGSFETYSKNPDIWKRHFDWTFTCVDGEARGSEPYVGTHAIPNLRYRLHGRIKRTLRWPGRLIKQMILLKKSDEVS